MTTKRSVFWTVVITLCLLIWAGYAWEVLYHCQFTWPIDMWTVCQSPMNQWLVAKYALFAYSTMWGLLAIWRCFKKGVRLLLQKSQRQDSQ